VDVKHGMRVLILLLTALLAATSAIAQTAPKQDVESPLNLPVSIDRIRDALAKPASAEPLKGLNAPDGSTTFRVDVTEHQKIEELMATIKFEKPGPRVAGGAAYYEQFQRLFPPINNPLVQPYAAFSTGEAVTLAVEALLEKYVGDKMSQVMGPALRAQAEREAREEVARALAAYWAERPVTAAARSSTDSGKTTTPPNN
jgi:hypothetical protein